MALTYECRGHHVRHSSCACRRWLLATSCTCIDPANTLPSCYYISHIDAQKFICHTTSQEPYLPLSTTAHYTKDNSFLWIQTTIVSHKMKMSSFSQNEDEFIFYILPTLQEGSSSQASQKQAIPTSCRNGATFMHEILIRHETVCRRRFHMERDIFEALSRRLRESNLLADSRYVSVEEQLGIFLYVVSKNASNRTLQDQFQHSGDLPQHA
jgi:hypothetical protein